MERRRFIELTAAVTASAAGSPVWAAGKKKMRTRKIPKSGEEIPVVGLGTSRTFDVGASAAELAPLAEVMTAFLGAGGRVVDSSPMYGEAERVVGDLLERTGNLGKVVRGEAIGSMVS